MNFLAWGIIVGKKFLKVHSLSGSFDFDISKFKSTRQSLWRNYFLLNLAYGYNDQNWLWRGGITLAVEEINRIRYQICICKRNYEKVCACLCGMGY